MKKLISSIFVLSFLVLSLFGQTNTDPKAKATGNSSPGTSPADLAKAALSAHGGDKLRGIKTLVLRGSVDVTTSMFPQALAGTFAMIFAGEKYRLDLNNPMQPISQVFDGVNTQTTIQNGFELPPISRVGFFMLSKVGDTSFPVSALPANGKKKNGFRITSPEGFYTDYFVEEKTGQLKGYESSYDMNGRVATTSVAIDKCRSVEGVLIPEKFSQRFDLGQLTAYADFKAKDIQVNIEVQNAIFTIQR